jgi:hypothetical protein
VDDASSVSSGHPRDDAAEQVLGLGWGDGTPLDPGGEIGAVHELHHQGRRPVDVQYVAHPDDVGMIDASLDLPLVDQAAAEPGTGQGEQLERMLGLQRDVADEVDLGHASEAQRTNDLVALDLLACGERTGHVFTPSAGRSGRSAPPRGPEPLPRQRTRNDQARCRG